MQKDDGLRKWWGRRSGVLKGSICLAGAGAAFVGINAVVRAVGDTIPTFQLAFLQQVVVVALIAPGILGKGIGVMKSAVPLRHLARCIATGVAILSGFVAMANLPVSETTALLFSRMIFTAALAALVLKEPVRAGAWLRIVIAAAGVVLVLSPDTSAVDLYGLAALVSALAISVSMLLIRALKEESAEAIVGWQAIGLVLLFAGPALYGWVPLDGRAALACAAVGTLLWAAQHLNVLAYRYAEAAAIQPAEATRLVVAIAIDGLVFGLVPSAAAFGGVTLIVMATMLGRTAWRGRSVEKA